MRTGVEEVLYKLCVCPYRIHIVSVLCLYCGLDESLFYDSFFARAAHVGMGGEGARQALCPSVILNIKHYTKQYNTQIVSILNIILNNIIHKLCPYCVRIVPLTDPCGMNHATLDKCP